MWADFSCARWVFASRNGHFTNMPDNLVTNMPDNPVTNMPDNPDAARTIFEQKGKRIGV